MMPLPRRITLIRPQLDRSIIPRTRTIPHGRRRRALRLRILRRRCIAHTCRRRADTMLIAERLLRGALWHRRPALPRRAHRRGALRARAGCALVREATVAGGGVHARAVLGLLELALHADKVEESAGDDEREERAADADAGFGAGGET